MRILISSYMLDGGGVATATLTMYKELVKRGNQVTVFSPQGGKLASRINVTSELNERLDPDIIIAQHNPCAVDLRCKFPDVPMIYYAHGLTLGIEQVPDFMLNRYFAINEEVKKDLEDHGIPGDKITIIRDFIDTTEFKIEKLIGFKPEKVLFISNYKKWTNYKTVRDACAVLGLKLKCIGSPYGRSYEVAKEINEADIVVSWARGVLEGMACGREVISWDRKEGDGYINYDNYYASRQDNFSGRINHIHYTAESLAEEMKRYDPKNGYRNRTLILAFHNPKDEVDQILAEIRRLI